MILGRSNSAYTRTRICDGFDSQPREKRVLHGKCGYVLHFPLYLAGYLKINGMNIVGTGKSFVLKVLKEELIKKYSAKTVFITAATGIAAIPIGGTTLHSFAGIGLGFFLSPPPHNKCSNANYMCTY